VFLEKPKDTFARLESADSSKPWPITYETLKPHYDTVRSTVGVDRLPEAYYRPPGGGRPRVPKTGQFIDAAKDAGLNDPELAELAITFKDEHGAAEPGASLGRENLHRRERHTCTL